MNSNNNQQQPPQVTLNQSQSQPHNNMHVVQNQQGGQQINYQNAQGFTGRITDSQFNVTNQNYIRRTADNNYINQTQTLPQTAPLKRSGITDPFDQQQIAAYIDQYMQSKLEPMINYLIDVKLDNFKKDLAIGGNSNINKELNQFRQEISKNINENYESFSQAIKKQNDNLVIIDKKTSDLIQRLNSQIQLQWQEFEKQKLLNKQQITNIETKMTEFENFITIQGSQKQDNQSYQRRTSRRGSDLKMGIQNLQSEDKIQHLQAELDSQRALVDQLQSNFQQMINSSNIQASKLTRRISNLNSENLGFDSVQSLKSGDISYKLDKNNFLVDSEGNYIVNEQGNILQLNQDQINLLRQSKMLQ